MTARKCLLPSGIAFKTLLLICLVLVGLSLGLCNEILVPTLPNLCLNVQTSYETMGRMLSFRNLGSIISLIVFGYYYDVKPKCVENFVCILCAVCGLCALVIPWCKSIITLSLAIFIQCGSMLAATNGCQVLILRYYRMHFISIMQIYHMGYSFGSVFSGILVNAFIGRTKIIPKITEVCLRELSKRNVSNNFTIKQDVIGKLGESKFELPYVITGIYCCFAAVLLQLYFRFCGKKLTPTYAISDRCSWTKNVLPKYVANGNVLKGASLTVGLCFLYFFYISAVGSFFSFFIVYATDPCKSYVLDQRQSTYMYSAMMSCFLIGRLINSIIMRFIPTAYFVFLAGLNFFCLLVLAIYGHLNLTVLWIFTCILRFANSVVYPAGTSWTNKFIIVNGSLISFAFIGGCVGNTVGQGVGGYLIDNFGSSNLVRYSATCMGALFVVIVTMAIVGKYYGERVQPLTGSMDKAENSDDGSHGEEMEKLKEPTS